MMQHIVLCQWRHFTSRLPPLEADLPPKSCKLVTIRPHASFLGLIARQQLSPDAFSVERDSQGNSLREEEAGERKRDKSRAQHRGNAPHRDSGMALCVSQTYSQPWYCSL